MSDINVGKLMSFDDLPGFDGSIEAREPFEVVEIKSDFKSREKDLEDDYSLVRRNLNVQSQMGMEALKVALENARNSDAPRQMEVFSTLMGQITSLNESIVKVHKQINETTGTGRGNTTINAGEGSQVVFQGSPYDLQGRVGSQSEVKREKVIEHESYEEEMEDQDD